MTSKSLHIMDINSKISCISCTIILITVISYSVQTESDIHPKKTEQAGQSNVKVHLGRLDDDKKKINSTATDASNKPVVVDNIKQNPNSNLNEPQSPNINNSFEDKSIEIESGAITRGVLVFVGISLLFIIYVGIRTYRRKKQDRSKSIVRKYGIRTRRTDIEMEPLPLSDDEEDETLFDLSTNRSNNR